MVYRYSWLAGLGALGLAFVLMNDLLRPTVDGPPWQFVVLSGALLGGVITWTALAYRLPTWVTAALNLVTLGLAVVRIGAPETTAWFLPTGASFSELRLQFDQALEIIRNGVEPVIPVSGIVIIVTAVFWAAAAILVWGLMRGHPYVALIPPFVLALQFATMNRNPSGVALTTVFVALVAATLAAVNADERDQGAGRLRRNYNWEPSRRMSPLTIGLAGVAVAGSVFAVGLLHRVVPADGVVEWRAASGLTGDFFGSISYNPFVSIQQGLVSQSDADVFVFRLDGDVPPEQVYFRLLTMESYGGGQFFADRPTMVSLDEDRWEDPGHRFAGPTQEISASVQITRLRMDWIPTPYVPVDLDASDAIVRSIRVRPEDGAMRLDGGRTYTGMQYTVLAAIPRPDVSVLAAGPDGGLSPVFAAAANDPEDPKPVPEPVPAEVREEPPDSDVYLDLPEDLDPGIRALAAAQTRNLVTPFEKALALEAFLRSFTYDVDIPAGHGATDLADWLLDPESPNYRRGYCEQFATSMAVMARTLDIPSRVVLGFTPGDVLPDGRVVVRDRNAHAWVELWMPTQGWVRFDPTPRSDGVNPATVGLLNAELGFDISAYLELPDPERPDVAAANPLRPQIENPNQDVPAFIGGGGAADGGDGFSIPAWLPIFLTVAGAALALFGSVPGIKWLRRRRRLARLEAGDITAAWEEIVSRLGDLGERIDPAATPVEVAEEVDPALRPLAHAYGRSVYGPPRPLPRETIESARRSFDDTEASLSTRYSRLQRTLAWYRPGSLLARRPRNGDRRGADRKGRRARAASRNGGNGTR